MSHEDVFGIVGATLAGAYYVERVVAQGGFAVVYRGIHAGFRQPIALKCLSIPDTLTDAQRTTFLERFREEGELLFRLSAAISDVVRPLHIDAVQLPDGVLMPFLALEWLDGEGFDQVLLRKRGERKPGMDLLTLVDTLRPVAQALARAHNFPSERGTMCVVHRDLKPENLFMCTVAGAPAIKILDYGIAEVCSVVHQMQGTRAWGQMNPFTPGYGAPEQWAPDRFGTCGPWTDVWGLAITMIEALIGRPAIDGERDEMRRIALDPRKRPTPRALGSNTVPKDVEAVFARALVVDPRERTRDMETFWTELEVAAGVSPSISQRGVSAPLSRRAPRREAVLELLDDPHEASIDLDLERAPESMRSAPRSSRPSLPPPGLGLSAQWTPLPITPPQGLALGLSSGPRSSRPGTQARGLTPSVPPAHGSRPSVPPHAISSSMPPVLRFDEGNEVELPLRDEAPISQPVPTARSRYSSSSVRPEALPGSVRPASLIPPAPLPMRAPLSSEPDAPVQTIAAAIKGRFKIPTLLLVLAVAITLVDLAVVRSTGEPMSLGPVRSFWVAGPLALVGALLLVWKIVVAEEDDG